MMQRRHHCLMRKSHMVRHSHTHLFQFLNRWPDENPDVAPGRSQYAASRPPQQLQRSHTASDILTSSRNRRSASLSEHFGKDVTTLSHVLIHRADGMAGEDEIAHGTGHDVAYYHRVHHQQPPVPPRNASRPGTSLGIARETTGPRRVTVEERERQEMDVRVERGWLYTPSRPDNILNRFCSLLVGHGDGLERMLTLYGTCTQSNHLESLGRPSQSKQTPPPNHADRPTYAHHRRRESDTLRSSVPYPQTGSPTVSEAPPARVSPTTKGLISQASNGYNPKHNRSPTAPESSLGTHLSGRTLVNGEDDPPSSAERERRGSDLDRPAHKERPKSQNLPEQQRQRQSSDTAQANSQQHQSQVSDKDKLQPRSHLVVSHR